MDFVQTLFTPPVLFFTLAVLAMAIGAWIIPGDHTQGTRAGLFTLGVGILSGPLFVWNEPSFWIIHACPVAAAALFVWRQSALFNKPIAWFALIGPVCLLFLNLYFFSIRGHQDAGMGYVFSVCFAEIGAVALSSTILLLARAFGPRPILPRAQLSL